MDTVTLAHAKEHLEDLIERAARGEDVRIIVPHHGIVRLTPATQEKVPPTGLYPSRVPGLLSGKVHVSDEELFTPLTEAEMAWLSGETSP